MSRYVTEASNASTRVGDVFRVNITFISLFDPIFLFYQYQFTGCTLTHRDTAILTVCPQDRLRASRQAPTFLSPGSIKIRERSASLYQIESDSG